MCKENKEFIALLLSGLLLAFVVGALRAEEQYFLITESELRSIELYRETSEREKLTLLSRAQGLNRIVVNLESESGNLSNQLTTARELREKSERYYGEYVAGLLITISSKNGEIAGLEQQVADETMKAKAYKKRMAWMLVIVILMAALSVLFFVRRFLWK